MLIGTLFCHINSTKSPYGRRLLYQWVTKPLIDIQTINDRLDAVTEIIANNQITVNFNAHRYIDIEKHSAKIHEFGTAADTGAIYYGM